MTDGTGMFKLARSTVTVLAPTSYTDADADRALIDVEGILERYLSGACEEIQNVFPDFQAVIES